MVVNAKVFELEEKTMMGNSKGFGEVDEYCASQCGWQIAQINDELKQRALAAKALAETILVGMNEMGMIEEVD